MKVCNLSSGSTGNSSYIETENYKILIDLGRNKKYIVENLKSIGVDYHDIDYVFITHTHDDHISALKTFMKGIKAKLVITDNEKEDLSTRGYLENVDVITYTDEINIEGLNIKAFKMSHDSSDIRSFVIEDGNSTLVYITDTGYINSRYFKEFKNKDMYLIECNHDIEMLTHGPYPDWLKARVLSDVGHLSNKFCGTYLSKLIGDKTKYIGLLHLSEKNNDEKHALDTVYDELVDNDISGIKIFCTRPTERSEVIEL